MVLLRHGESVFNAAERFTGWTDAELTEKGRDQARRAGRQLREAGHEFDFAMTSWLRRAVRTAWLAVEEMDRMWLPVESDWRLNERHFGAFEGLTRAEVVARWGDEPMRRIHERPPLMHVDDDRHPARSGKYRGLAVTREPAGEGFDDLLRRVRPVFDGRIAPAARNGGRVLVVAHGVVVRALDRLLSEGNMDGLPIPVPTATPLVYRFEEGRVKSREWLGEVGVADGSLPSGAG